ncbi:MAG: DUF2330 domain-containing protein [Candidatus Krumholzibacteriia bacterium]
MGSSRNRHALAAACLAFLAGAEVHAVCCPIPCDDCWITSQGQLNLVVMDRDRGEVRLLPNVNFVGMAEDFALVVPTPAIPEFEVASRDVWAEGRALTSPIPDSRPADEGIFGCADDRIAVDFGAEEADDVFVHVERTIGAFLVTVISSEDPNALVDWLAEHGFALGAEDATRFAPYVQRGWFFTAMRLDPNDPGNQMPPGGWDADVHPVLFVYEAQEFELPLPIMAINRAGWMSVFVYVVDDHRMTFEGFDTDYANRLSAGEYAAIAERYPNLARFLSPGRFVTRLQRTFTDADAMDRSIVLERSPTDDEFRRTFRRRFGAIPAEFLLFAFLLVPRRRRMRRVQARRPGAG